MVFHVYARRLLRYLETHGEGAVVRPWVWIAYLFLGPALGTIAFQMYIFIAVSGRLKSNSHVPHAALLSHPDGNARARFGNRYSARL